MSLGNPAPPMLDGAENSSRGATFLKIGWGAVTDAAKYTVRCNASSQSFTQPAVPFHTSFTSLSPNTLYHLQLEVEDASGVVKTSSVLEKYTRPERPSFVTLANPAEPSRRPQSVVLTWEDVPGIDIYEVERDSTEVRKTGDPGSLGFEFTGLNPNVLYTFRVRSRVEDGSGRIDVSFDSSPLVVLTRPPTPGPLALIAQSNNSLRIDWQGISVFNNSAAAKVQLGRTAATDPGDDVRFTLSSLSATSQPDHFDSYNHPLLYGLRVVVSGNESFWSTALFRPMDSSAISRGGDFQRFAQDRATFLLALARSANG